MNTKKNIFIIGFIVVIAVSAAVYINSTKSKSNKTQKEPVKIGATLALSGSLAYFGQAEANGFQMAVDEINSQGGVNGRNIDLIIEDNAGETKQAITTVNKFLQTDSVDIVISAFTHITEAVKEVVAPESKLMLYVSTYRGIAEENPLFFRDYFDAFDSGVVIARSVQQQGYTKIGFLGEISTLCNEFEKGFTNKETEYGIKIIAKENYPKEEKDLKTHLLKLKSANPEAIVMCTWRHEPIVMKQLEELDMINTQTFHLAAPYLPSSDTAETRALYENNNTVSSWYGFVEQNTTVQQDDFVRRYQNQFGDKPNSDAMYAYDDTYVLKQALERCDNENRIQDSTCLSEKLLQTDFNGVAGRLLFNEFGVSNRDVLLIKVIDGSWTPLVE